MDEQSVIAITRKIPFTIVIMSILILFIFLDSDTTVLRTIASLLNIDYDSLVQVSFGHSKAKK